MLVRKGKLSRPYKIKIWFVCLSLILVVSLSLNNCRYDPALYPAQDILIPGPDVDIVGFSDGNIIVTPGYIMWVEDLKTEIVRLRKLLEED